MNFIDTLKSNFCSKKSCVILSGLLMLSGTVLGSSSPLPIRLGPPIRISPVPGPANPDPILENLVLVMDNHYQPPFYPGGFPDYLSQIYFWANYYVANGIKYNPCNDNIMHVGVGQNIIEDFTGTYPPFQGTIGSSSFATSFDRGLTWEYGPPIEQIIPLGGTISQIINSSFGPGLYFTYGKNGRLFAGGWGFFDMVPNGPNPFPQSGFIFTTSEDDGEHWAPRKIELASNINFFFGFRSRPGLAPREFYITPEPSNPNFLHASSMFELAPRGLYGNLFYTSSKNGGKTFAPFKQVYSMIDDPVWRDKFFDPNFPDPTYFVYGGFCLSSGFPIPFDDNTLLLPFLRVPVDRSLPIFADQAVARSLDNGKTWSKVAGATELYIPSLYIYDPGFRIPFAGEIVRGFLSFPFFYDTTQQWSTPLVSPTTGRLYLTFEAFNPAFSDFTTGVNINQVLLSSSSDGGKTFSPNVQINRTPTDILPGAQQAFAHGAAITQDGYYCVAYYDFRNWTGFPGEDIANTPLQTDVWMDVYKETEDPRGGSTGVGLDFVGEFRLTPESYNSRIINLTTTPPYQTNYMTGTPEGITMTVNNNNELFVVYSAQTGEGVSPANISIGYKGMTIDTNPYITCFLQRFKFANASNQ